MMGHIDLNLELYPGIVDLRFRFRFFVHFLGWKIMHFTSANSRLISSLQVFLSFHVPIPVYHYQKVNAYYYIGYTFINRF